MPQEVSDRISHTHITKQKTSFSALWECPQSAPSAQGFGWSVHMTTARSRQSRTWRHAFEFERRHRRQWWRRRKARECVPWNVITSTSQKNGKCFLCKDVSSETFCLWAGAIPAKDFNCFQHQFLHSHSARSETRRGWTSTALFSNMKLWRGGDKGRRGEERRREREWVKCF